MLRALLLLLPLAAAAQAPEAPFADAPQAALLDAAAAVDVAPDGDAQRAVEVHCPAEATCRLMARVEPLAPAAPGAVAVRLAGPARGLGCAAAPCEVARGLPAGRSVVPVALAAVAPDLAPAGAHRFRLQLWVLADPLPSGALRPFSRPSSGITTYPLTPLFR